MRNPNLAAIESRQKPPSLSARRLRLAGVRYLRLVHAGAVALASRAGDLHPALAAQDADEPADGVFVWTGFSVGATLAQYGLHQAAMLSPAMASSSSRLTGAILVAAGAYQLTSWKGRCLTHCRSPLGFLMTNWRDGTTGAFRMGFSHGAYCLGCCWALMCVLFVVG